MGHPSAKGDIRSDTCVHVIVSEQLRQGYSQMGHYRVHVPLARGSFMPDIDSIKDDLPVKYVWYEYLARRICAQLIYAQLMIVPALCAPMTAICGRSMSIWTL